MLLLCHVQSLKHGLISLPETPFSHSNTDLKWGISMEKIPNIKNFVVVCYSDILKRVCLAGKTVLTWGIFLIWFSFNTKKVLKRRHNTILYSNWKLGILRVLQEVMCIWVLTLSELLRIMANSIIQAYIVHTLHRTSLIGFDFHFGQAYSLVLNTFMF